MNSLLKGIALAIAVGWAVRPSSSADVITAMGNVFTGSIRAATGYVPPKVSLYKRCDKVLYYPTVNGWHMWTCPLPKGHVHPHADENYYPFLTDEDAEFFERHYRMVMESENG